MTAAQPVPSRWNCLRISVPRPLERPSRASRCHRLSSSRDLSSAFENERESGVAGSGRKELARTRSVDVAACRESVRGVRTVFSWFLKRYPRREKNPKGTRPPQQNFLLRSITTFPKPLRGFLLATGERFRGEGNPSMGLLTSFSHQFYVEERRAFRSPARAGRCPASRTPQTPVGRRRRERRAPHG